jgi:hypothetical protein
VSAAVTEGCHLKISNWRLSAKANLLRTCAWLGHNAPAFLYFLLLFMNVVEWEFCELRISSVLGSSPSKELGRVRPISG